MSTVADAAAQNANGAEPTDPDHGLQTLVKRTTLGAWVALGVLMLLYILNSLDRGLLSLLVKPVKADLGIGDVQMSLLLGFAFALFYAVCGIPIGWIVDRFSRQLTLWIGVTLWSLATIASGLANTYPQLLLARIALGAGEATLGPSAHSIIADKFPKHRLATALSIYTGGAVLGTGGSIALGGIVVEALSKHPTITLPVFGTMQPWQAAFVLLGLPGLVLALSVFLFKEPARLHGHTAGRDVKLLPFLRSNWKTLAAFTFSFALFSMAVYGTLVWLPAHMERAFGWGAGKAGPAVGILNILSVGLGTVGGGMIADKLFSGGRKDAHLRVFFWALIAGAPVGIVGFLLPDPFAFLACMTWLKLCCFSFVGYAAAAIQAISPQALRGRMAAVYLLVLALIGNGLGPTLIAFLTENVFHDPNKLGAAISLTLAILTPIALLSAWIGMKHMRESVARLEAATSG
ncbi:MAG: permease of the major facilitator superfamily [Caulobacter sp.]|nr:permease of the major facilitator superfamily [Caulobacter sp.]